MNDHVAIYVRLSREDEGKFDGDSKSRSVQNQIEILTNYAKDKKMIVEEIFVDDGYSGASLNRPGFSKLINYINEKKIKTLLVKDVSRLGRNLREVGWLIDDFFPSNNVRLISVNDNYDSQNSYDDFSVAIKNFLNEYYLKELKLKCKKSREYMAKKKHMSFYPKYGYKFNERGQEVVDEQSANIVKKIFDLIADKDLTTKAVAKLLNDEKVLTRSQYAVNVLKLKPLHKNSARCWDESKVWEIVTDIEYCGHSVNLGKSKISKAVFLKNTHPAIVSKEVFEKANKNLSNRRKIKSCQDISHKLFDAILSKRMYYSIADDSYFVRDTISKKRIYRIKRKAIESVLMKDLLSAIEHKNSLLPCVASSNKNCVDVDKFNNEFFLISERFINHEIDKNEYDKIIKTLNDNLKDDVSAKDNSIEKKCKFFIIKSKFIKKNIKNTSFFYKMIEIFIKRIDIIYKKNNMFEVNIKYKF